MVKDWTSPKSSTLKRIGPTLQVSPRIWTAFGWSNLENTTTICTCVLLEERSGYVAHVRIRGFDTINFHLTLQMSALCEVLILPDKLSFRQLNVSLCFASVGLCFVYKQVRRAEVTIINLVFTLWFFRKHN